MRVVVPPIRIVQKILGMQKTTGGPPYRLSTDCMLVEQTEGVLLYHTLTGELLLLSHNEAALLGALPGSVPPLLADLVPRWFLRSQEADDMALADQVRSIAEHMRNKEAALTRYTIFTTMDCNARCFYCYEAGWKKATMTEQTALDTAKYIIAHRGGRPVHLKWFGGEPLVNTKVIDVITDYLRKQGCEFQSTVTSNGYLFDEALIQRARDIWNLKQVQLTLDGTEEVYNQRKAYVNPQGSPYRRVLRNIGLLLDAGIPVNIRLNMDNDNVENLYALVDELAERFQGRSGLDIYPTVLWENTGVNSPSYTEEERRSFSQKRLSIQAYAEENNIATRASLNRGFVVNSCSADSDCCTVVTPEGWLSRCAVCKDDAIWGSVYSDEVDKGMLQKWKERKPPEADCNVCVVYPQCVRIKKCPQWLKKCSPIERAYRENKIRSAVLRAYEEWKAVSEV